MEQKITTFAEFNLPPLLSDAVKAMGYSTPTPIQAGSIPPALMNRDIIGCAQTGTGKTAAFGIPLVASLLKNPRKRALILAPTRELVQQIEKVLCALTTHTPQLKPALVIGGASMNVQIKTLRSSPRIIVATPGRLVDHLRRGNTSLSSTEILVLDEADRMLDMGFMPQINEVMRFLPKHRQTLLFSATFPPEIQKLTSRYTKDPVNVAVGPTSKPIEKIDQVVMQTTQQQKNDLLMDELNAIDGSVLVFARTKRRTDRLTKFLAGYGYKVNRIHGDRSQAQRNEAIDGFRRGKFRVLVATDVAARGIDIPNISNVINYDVPVTPEDYVHRIGRTGRMGAEGRAVSFVTSEDRLQWKAIARHVGGALAQRRADEPSARRQQRFN